MCVTGKAAAVENVSSKKSGGRVRMLPQKQAGKQISQQN